MFTVRHATLKKIALAVWFTGVFVLVVKSSSLFLGAKAFGASPLLEGIAVCTAILVGWIKAKFMFVGFCRKNLVRIDGLKLPKLWQFYRPRFFFFLICMIVVGKLLASVAQGNSLFMVAVATVELSVGTALLVSSRTFWTYKNEVSH